MCSFNFFKKVFYFACINILPTYLCIETACMPDAHNSLNTVRELLELELRSCDFFTGASESVKF